MTAISIPIQSPWQLKVNSLAVLKNIIRQNHIYAHIRGSGETGGTLKTTPATPFLQQQNKPHQQSDFQTSQPLTSPPLILNIMKVSIGKNNSGEGEEETPQCQSLCDRSV